VLALLEALVAAEAEMRGEAEPTHGDALRRGVVDGSSEAVAAMGVGEGLRLGV